MSTCDEYFPFLAIIPPSFPCALFDHAFLSFPRRTPTRSWPSGYTRRDPTCTRMTTTSPRWPSPSPISKASADSGPSKKSFLTSTGIPSSEAWYPCPPCVRCAACPRGSRTAAKPSGSCSTATSPPNPRWWRRRSTLWCRGWALGTWTTQGSHLTGAL